MNRSAIFSTLIILLGFQSILAQDGIQFNLEGSLPSYTLFTDSGGTHLIDNCGYEVHSWPQIRDRDISYHVKLLPNGNILYQDNREMYEMDWEGDIIYSFRAPSGLIFEYEVIKKENGNYLCLGRESMSNSEFRDMGYNLSLGSPDVIDVVVEIDPTQDSIIWDWHLADHVIQERDSTLNNYGVIKENPQLLNLDAISTYDWTFYESFMINGMGYNDELEMIALSVRKMSEVIFIDNSTTAEESTDHSGGRYGKGGDVIFRWGNPQNYGYGTQDDQILYYQHNPIWVHYGEYKNQVSVFNNGLDRPVDYYSSIDIFQVNPDENGNFPFDEELGFLPINASYSYNNLDHEYEVLLVSDYTSGAQMLENGNLFITEGRSGRLFEVTPAGDMVWEYIAPGGWYLFRAEKYPLDYTAFDGKILEPNGTVESPSSPAVCEIATISSIIQPFESNIEVKFDNSSNNISIANIDNTEYSFEIYDAFGRVVMSDNSDPLITEINVGFLSSGFYIISINDLKSNAKRTFKFTIVE